MKDLKTICVHGGTHTDSETNGILTPLYLSTSYAYLDVETKAYPRYFNIPNHDVVADKISTLEHGETAMIFGSGMAAISTAMTGHLKHGDHVVIQKGLYGGTTTFIQHCLDGFGVTSTSTEGLDAADFEAAIRSTTKVIYIETPSNPLLTLTDIAAVAEVAKRHGLITMIDNTFASPINQNPIDLGIDVVIHSATKYLGGHSDICAGAVVTSHALMEPILKMAKGLGGNLNAETLSLLERSMKTLSLRVHQQNENAMAMAEWLSHHSMIEQVYYPGLSSHPQHELACKQMHGFGGMVAFELPSYMDPIAFQQQLNMISPAMSLGGVESTICSPYLTSHATITEAERETIGIKNSLLRFSVGIEGVDDLMEDLEQALEVVEKKKVRV